MSVKERHFSNNLTSPVVMFRSFERPNLLLKFNQFKAWWIISMHQSYKSECIKLRRIFYRTFNTRSAKSCSKFPRVFWKFVKNCYFLEWKIQKIATLRFIWSIVQMLHILFHCSLQMDYVSDLSRHYENFVFLSAISQIFIE